MDSSPTLTEAIDAFVLYAQNIRRLSPRTCASHRRHLGAFARWRGPQTPVSSLTYMSLEAYILSKAQVSPGSLANIVAVLHTFGAYLLLQNLVAQNPATLLPFPRRTRPLPLYLSLPQIEALIAALPFSPLGRRNQALTRVLYSGALRVGEALALTTHDLLWGESKIYVRTGKTAAASRYVEFLPPAQEAVRSYLAVREQFILRPIPLLFLTYQGQALSGKDVNRFLARAGETAGLPLRVHAHLLRHSMATHLYQKGVDLKELRDYLGHASIQSTDVYTHMGDRQVSESVRRVHPWAQPAAVREAEGILKQEGFHAQP
ncbi:MAG: tyrosine-type recombinase/integrase [Chloroflexi bacterium]|nr:tyrosine-type recombinase/integrase [Chloroflexota bacterium]